MEGHAANTEPLPAASWQPGNRGIEPWENEVFLRIIRLQSRPEFVSNP